MKRFPYLPLIVFVLLLASCGARDDEAVRFFAAASTVDLAEDLATLYEEQTGVAVTVNAGSSGTLARQIDAGADAGVFLSAHTDWAAWLVERCLVREAVPLMVNRLVLVVPMDSPLPDFAPGGGGDLTTWLQGRLALGDPEHVPAGRYARQALASRGWWDGVESRVLPTADVRAALALVELGEAGAGIVYATDALRSEAVRVAGEFPESFHDPVIYPLALAADAPPEAEAFYQFLRDDHAARELYRSHGFRPAAGRVE